MQSHSGALIMVVNIVTENRECYTKGHVMLRCSSVWFYTNRSRSPRPKLTYDELAWDDKGFWAADDSGYIVLWNNIS